MHGVTALPDSPQVAPPQPPQHKPSPNNNVLPPKPAHLAAQAAAAASSFRQIKPPMPSPPQSSPPTSKADQEVRYYVLFKYTYTHAHYCIVLYSTRNSVFTQKTHILFLFKPPQPPPYLYPYLVHTFNFCKYVPIYYKHCEKGFCLFSSMVLAL